MPRVYSIADEREQLAAIYAGAGTHNWPSIKEMKDWRYTSNHNPYSSDDFGNVLNVLGARDASASRQFRVEFNEACSLPKN